MKGRDFVAELRAEEAIRQAEGMPAAAERAVWARLQRREPAGSDRVPTPVRRRAALFAGAAAIAVAAIALVLALPRRAARLGDLEVASRSPDLAAHIEAGIVTIEHGAATLVDRPSGLTIETSGPVSLRREARGVHLVRGRIDVSAVHRPATAAPATILVSHGAIEVMGTAFTVIQETEGGRVALREGKIQFRAVGGEVKSLRPGETLAWPLPPPTPAPSLAPAHPPAPAQPSPPVSARASASPTFSPVSRPPASEALLDHVEELRSRGDFEQAARVLRRALPGPPTPMRERLSFELGSLLTHQIGDASRACRQWDWHERHFPGGRYQKEVVRARAALACRGRSERP